MNNPDHIAESLETNFWVKIQKILRCGSGIRDGKNSDPGTGLEKFGSGTEKFGSGMEKIRIRDKHPGSGINIPDPTLIVQ
jgi:hypothetical protein